MESTACDVGKITSTECHKTNYMKKKGIVNVSSDLSEEDRILLKLRTGATEELHTICFHHRSVYLKKFELLQRKCCDPLKKHRKPVRKTLRVVNFHQHNDLLLKGLKVKPGEKLCCQCRTMLLFKSALQNDTSLVSVEELYPACYIACKYDHLWYFGMVSSVEKDHGDAIVKFLHPNGPSPSFYWPRHEDTCSVPIPHVLAIVDPPHTTSGRTYHFSKNCMEIVGTKMVQLEQMQRKKS